MTKHGELTALEAVNNKNSHQKKKKKTKICYKALYNEISVTVELPQKNDEKACGRQYMTWRKIVY